MAVPTSDHPGPTLPVVLRPSRTADVMAFVPLALVAAASVWRGEPGFAVALVAIVAPFGVVMRRRLRMVLDDDGVTVVRWGTTRVPWSEIRGFERGTRWRGGTQVLTTHGVVWSVVPASWFEGAAPAAQIERLEAIRRSRQTG